MHKYLLLADESSAIFEVSSFPKSVSIFLLQSSGGAFRSFETMLIGKKAFGMFENPEVAFGGAGRLLGLIETIYSAVQQPELWSTVLEQIAEAVHGESTTLFARLPDNQLVAMARTNPTAWDAYIDYYSSVNLLMLRCDEMFSDGEVRFAHRAMPDTEFKKSEFYNDFFQIHNMHYSMGLKVPLPSLPAAYLSCQRPYAKGPFEEQEGLVYRTLMPHLQRALTLHLQFAKMQSHIRGVETALAAYDHALLGLNPEGKVILVSQHAEAMIRAGDGIRVTNGRLSTDDAAKRGQLAAALSAAVTGRLIGAGANASLLIRRKSNPAPLQLTVVPHRSSLPGSVALAALVFIGDPAVRSSSKSALLQILYDLSPTEARVANLLAEGLTIREIADRCHMALETARFHTKKILAKTGSRRQAELMKLILTLPNV